MMGTGWCRRGVCGLWLAASALASMPAAAQQAGGTGGDVTTRARAVVSIGRGYSDNIGRDGAGNEISSSFNALGLSFLLGRDRPRLQANFSGDVDLRRYEDVPAGSDDDELRGSVDGMLVARLVPNVLTWDAEGSLGQIRTNPFDADRLGNRERVTVVSTGPRLNVPLGERNFLQASAQAGRRMYEESGDFDSDSLVASLGVFRALSPVSQLGLQVSRSEVEYDGTQPDFEVDSAFVSYSRELASGGVQASVGASEVSVLEQTRSTQLLRLGWNRDVGARSNLSISGGREYTDAGAVFRAGGGVSGFGGFGLTGGLADARRLQNSRLRDVLLTGNPLERSSATVGWRITGQRTEFFVASGVSQDRFELDDTFDNDGVHFDVELSREFTPRWSGRIDVRAYRREFEISGQEFDEVVGRLTTTRRLGTRAGVTLDFRRYSRDIVLSDSAGFDESIYSVFFNYAFGQ